MTLKTIKTVNLQSHREVEVTLPETGLVRFSGPNSNGKSVITKVTRALISGEINQPKVRNTLISKDAVAGEVIYESYAGDVLTCHLQREASVTYVSLKKADGERITRYLADKTWLDLVYDFGFVYNKERDVPLQIIDDATPLLFIDTSNKVNFEVLNTALTDEKASLALDQLVIAKKDITKSLTNLSEKLAVYKKTMNDFEIYDIEDRERRIAKLKKLCDVLDRIYFPVIPTIPNMKEVKYYDIHYPTIPDLPNMQQVKYYDINYPTIPKINYPKIYDIHIPVIEKIGQIVKDIKELKAQRCPTCGRLWVDES